MHAFDEAGPAAAGGRWGGTVVVTNTAPVARRPRLHAVDAEVLPGGAFAPGSEHGRQRAGRWTRTSRSVSTRHRARARVRA